MTSLTDALQAVPELGLGRVELDEALARDVVRQQFLRRDLLGVVVVDVPYHLGVGDQGWLGSRRSAATSAGRAGQAGDTADLGNVTSAG